VSTGGNPSVTLLRRIRGWVRRGDRVGGCDPVKRGWQGAGAALELVVSGQALGAW